MEINPIHNGHIYFLNQIDKNENDILIAIISTTLVQRGEITVLNKHDKAKLLLNNKVDIVIELPSVLANQGGLYFAKHAINILHELKITDLYFGSESNNIKKLENILDLNKKINFKDGIHKEELKNLESNDILGISYLKAIKEYNIKPHLIKRINNKYNDVEKNDSLYQSATYIRKNLDNKDVIKDFLPKESLENIKIHNEKDLYLLFINNLQNCLTHNINIFLSEENQILYKINKIIKNNDISSIEELINLAKDKNNSKYKIQRIILNTIFLITQNSITNQINYIHLLGFNSYGKNYLSKLDNPKIVSSLKNINDNNALYEINISNVYNILTKQSIKHDFIPPVYIKNKKYK